MERHCWLIFWAIPKPNKKFSTSFYKAKRWQWNTNTRTDSASKTINVGNNRPTSQHQLVNKWPDLNSCETGNVITTQITQKSNENGLKENSLTWKGGKSRNRASGSADRTGTIFKKSSFFPSCGKPKIWECQRCHPVRKFQHERDQNQLLPANQILLELQETTHDKDNLNLTAGWHVHLNKFHQ